jgi:hypothetical protein
MVIHFMYHSDTLSKKLKKIISDSLILSNQSNYQNMNKKITQMMQTPVPLSTNQPQYIGNKCLAPNASQKEKDCYNAGLGHVDSNDKNKYDIESKCRNNNPRTRDCFVAGQLDWLYGK